MASFNHRSPLLPHWTQISTPSPERPYWHETEDGTRHSVVELLVGQDPETAEQLARLHAQAVANLLFEAYKAGAARDDRTKRRLVHAAGLLASEMVGHRPTALTAPR